MNYSSGGVGSITHLAMEAFRLAAGFEAVHVPFRGAPEALTEVLAGRADFYFSPLPAVLPFLQDGKLQALAVSGSRRASGLPNVPTVAEAGYAEATYNFWAGLFAPSKTPAPDHRAHLSGDRQGVAASDAEGEVRPSGIRSHAARSSCIRQADPGEFVLNTKVAEAAGVKAN